MWLFFRVVGSVVAVPIAEELAFQSSLTRRLLAHDFQSIPPGELTSWSLLKTSLLFGVLHGRRQAGILA
jgi:membrane protease YdiL (CAAX protease family)